MKTKKWIFYPENQPLISSLSSELKVSEFISRILVNRGIETADEALHFLRPQLNDLPDPYLMADMEKAAERIQSALNNREKVLIYGDFDADGITSTALLVHFFRLVNATVSYYIPNRVSEGYSFTPEGLQEILRRKTDLVISVDSGINSVEEIAYLRQNGVDVIVTDHHEPPEKLPDALAILNPKRPQCNYPFKELSGVGVAFKLAWGASQHLSKNKKVSPEFRQFLLNALAWVSLGTITDLVPLRGENRVLAKFGLPAIQNSTNPGLRALCDIAGSSRTLTSEDISFRIGPRINAAGRMGRADQAIELFLTSSYQEALGLATTLDNLNKDRQTIEQKIYEEIITLPNLESEEIIIESQEGWHPGVIGVVASKLVEAFGKPVVLVTYNNNKGRGSCRSVPDFDIFKALTHCSNLLITYGGHSSAGGLSIEPGTMPAFKEKLIDYLKNTNPEADFQARLKIDSEIHLSSLSRLLLSEIDKLCPFGEKNPYPIFASTDIQLARPPQLVGRNGNHLSFIIRQGDKTFKSIAFGRGSYHDQLSKASRFSMAYTPKLNFFNGRTNIELEVKDFRFEND